MRASTKVRASLSATALAVRSVNDDFILLAEHGGYECGQFGHFPGLARK